MGSTITGASTLTDVCYAVCTALHRSGTTAVLTGGSAATFYAPERYQSRDADFIITMKGDPQASVQALLDLGFVARNGIYVHAETVYTLDFPPGPLAIGSSLVSAYATVHRNDEVLFLQTALAVAASGEIDEGIVAGWSRDKGASRKYAEFPARYREERRW